MKNFHLLISVILIAVVSGGCGDSPPEPIPVSAFTDIIRDQMCSDDTAQAVYEDITMCWDLVESTDVEQDEDSGAWVLHIGVTEAVANPSNPLIELQGDVVCQMASSVWPDWVVLEDPGGRPVRWDAQAVTEGASCTPDEDVFRAEAKACDCEIPSQDSLVQMMKIIAEEQS